MGEAAAAATSAREMSVDLNCMMMMMMMMMTTMMIELDGAERKREAEQAIEARHGEG